MTTFQLLLLIITAGIFYLFFKQLLSGQHPKRGVDFEAKVADEQIGGITRLDKTFSQPEKQLTRMEQLIIMADEAVQKEDFLEAKKALGAALIIDEKNVEALQRIGYVLIEMKSYGDAKPYYETLLELDASDDMAHARLANLYHHLGDNINAEKHHETAIKLDEDYAAHHFNYANTLYDLERYDEALIGYTKAYELDSELVVAKEMIDKLQG